MGCIPDKLYCLSGFFYSIPHAVFINSFSAKHASAIFAKIDSIGLGFL